MTKISVNKLSSQNVVSDDEDNSDDIEDELIKDSVLKLTSNTFDEISPDEFVGAKLRNINIASQDDIEAEYKGVAVSRKSLSDLDSSDEVDDDDHHDSNSDDDIDLKGGSVIEENSSDDIESEYDDDDSSALTLDSSRREQLGNTEKEVLEKSSSIKSESAGDVDYSIYSKSTQSNVSEDVEKGTAVHCQMSIWESLLECRIKLQKALMASNRLPQVDNFTSFESECSQSDKKKILKTCGHVAALLQLLITIQKSMMNSFPDFNKKTSNGSTMKKYDNDDDEEEDDNGSESGNESIGSSIASGFSEENIKENEDNNINDDDSEEPPKKMRKLEDFSKELDKIHRDFIPARNEAIQKWNDKTRISSGRIKSSNFSAFEQSTLKQIEQILSDKERLIKRTQTKRSVYKILGKSDKHETKESDQLTEFDTEIFDDDDFYHKILREFIEQKSADISSIQQMGKQWAELQKMRSKMKRPIDVKATKGRRLRYTAHSKLVNFMAPIPYNSWTDEAESELFSSLFGEMHQK